MKEIERKILEIDKEQVLKKLQELGAEQIYKGLLKVCYFDTEDGTIEKKGELLRVREFAKSHTEVAYKKNKRVEKGNKVLDEYNLKTGDFESACKFFVALGYKETCAYEKHRTIFYYLDSEIVIDEYPEIPALLEIESKNEKQIDDIVNFLGLQKYESSTESIDELLQRKYPQIELNNLNF